MYKKITLMAMLLMLGMGAFAQEWTKPEPKASKLEVGAECYLYNQLFTGFYVGGNDYQTRASLSERDAYAVYLEKWTDSNGNWDGESYYITNYVKYGSPAGQTLCLYISETGSYNNEIGGIWVDQAKDGTNDKLFTFTQLDDYPTYLIGLSDKNTYFKGSELSDVYLSMIPSKWDTKLYFTSETDHYDYAPYWSIISAADYAAYMTALEQYEAAVLLGNDLAEAQATYPMADLTAIQNVYNNHESTAEQLNAARVTLAQTLLSLAKPDAPANQSYLIVNPTYKNNDNTGWEGSKPGFQTYENAEFYSTNYDYHQTITGLQPGVYMVLTKGFYRAGWADQDAEALTALQNEGDTSKQNALLYASSSTTPLATSPLPFASTGASETELGNDCSSNSFGYIPNNMLTASVFVNAGKYTPTQVVCYSDGTLTFGLKKDVTLNGDWTIFDDWKLYSMGDNDEALRYLKQLRMDAYPNFAALIDAYDIVYYGRDAYNAYSTAYNTLNAATTRDAIVAALPGYETESQNFQANVDAYNAYAAKVQAAEDFYIENQASMMGEGMDNLGMYVFDEQEPATGYPHPNGSGLYILNNGTLSTEQIIAETTYVQQLMDDALAGGMTDGMDVTDLIKNPHFAEEGVWTKEGFPEWPVGPDTYKLGQAYTILFNVYQDITGLQEGLYELTLKDLYRPANYGTVEYGNEPKAYVYMNGFEKKLNAIEDGATEGTENGHTYYIDGVGYVPNTVDEAAASFQAGNYGQTLYGLVTDGTMRIGIRSDLRYEGCWAAWSDFHLTFRAKNPEVLAEVIDMTVPNAQELLANQMGVEESLAIDEAITAAQTSEGEARYDAMVSLKEAMDAAQTCIDTYKKLSEVIEGLRQAITDNPDSSHIGEAQTLLNEAEEAYNQGTWNNETALQKVEEIGAMAVTLKLGDNTDEEQDVSDLIVNRDFNPEPEWGSKDGGWIKGWSTTAMNGYKEYTVSYNRAPFHLYQDLVGLPKGHYKVTVHTYYRAGYWNEEEQYIQQGKETHYTTLYAETTSNRAETPVLNLTEGATTEKYHDSKYYTLSNGLFAPDGTSGTAAWFAAGAYLNELEFDVGEDGKARIGLVKEETYPNDYEVVGEWNLYFYPEIREDVTSLIVNPDFIPEPEWGSKDGGWIKGWSTTAMNGYKEHTVSYNRSGFHLYQDLVGLKEGNYEVTVHTYYRAGYWNEEEQYIQQGKETHYTTLYAETTENRAEIPVLNLTEGATTEKYHDSKYYTLSNGLYAPDGTTGTVAWFNAGAYLNTLQFQVPTDGKARIGLIKEETYPNDYEVVGEWHLYYLGRGVTGIDETIEPATKGVAVEFYTLSGVRIDRPQPGINIVRMSDGSVRKVFLK